MRLLSTHSSRDWLTHCRFVLDCLSGGPARPITDNGMYGTIRMHQGRDLPGRVAGTDLVNPDFAAYARAFGGYGATVERTEDFPEAFAACRASGLPSIIHLRIDPDAILPAATLSGIRAKSLEAKGRG